MPTLKDQIAGDKLTIGSWIQLGHEDLVEMLASGPFDWLCIDPEHATISIDQCGIHVVEPDGAKLHQVTKDGYRFVSFASDMLLFAHHIRQIAEDIEIARSKGGAA